MARELKEQWMKLAIEARYDSKNLASLRKITPRQLQRIFRAGFGRTPQDWLNEQRILAAQELLRAGVPAKIVAIDLGFKQASHFSRQFKEYVGLPPTQFVALANDAPM